MAARNINVLPKTIKIGPFGVDGDPNFDVGPSVFHITMVTFFTGDVVDGLEISYINDQKESKTYRTGGRGGTPHEVQLRNDEYIKYVVVSLKSYNGETCIAQIEFKTNVKSYGPFGHEGVEKFTVPIAAGKVVGFFGKSDKYINSIGVHVSPA